MEKCFFLTSPFIEHEAKNSEGRSRSYCSRWAGAGCQKFGSFPAEGEVFFLDIPFYRTSLRPILASAQPERLFLLAVLSSPLSEFPSHFFDHCGGCALKD